MTNLKSKIWRAGADLSFQVCASCSTWGFEPSFHSMPRYHRVFGPGHLQFITSSTYRRLPVFVGERFCQIFVEVLGRLRQELGFRLVGWVLMPDHFHLLIQPWRADLKEKVCASLPNKEPPSALRTLFKARTIILAMGYLV